MEFIDLDNFVFKCSGRKVYAFSSIIGISPNGDAYYGHDGGIAEYDNPPLTPKEKTELARHVIERWEKYLADADAER